MYEVLDNQVIIHWSLCILGMYPIGRDAMAASHVTSLQLRTYVLYIASSCVMSLFILNRKGKKKQLVILYDGNPYKDLGHYKGQMNN